MCVYYVFGQRNVQWKEKHMKWNEMWCVVLCRGSLSFQTNVYFGHYTHIFIFFMLQPQRDDDDDDDDPSFTIVKWCYVFFFIYLCFRFTDKRNKHTHTRTHKVCRNRISFSILYIDISLWLAGPLALLWEMQEKRAYCKLK